MLLIFLAVSCFHEIGSGRVSTPEDFKKNIAEHHAHCLWRVRTWNQKLFAKPLGILTSRHQQKVPIEGRTRKMED